jgi:F-type H+-transporting ATPase subunit epsilon
MLHIKLITPRALVLEDEVDSVTLPGSAGQFTVLPDHALFISSLKEGELYVRQTEPDGKEKVTYFKIGKGFVEVEKNTVTILTATVQNI